MTRSPHDGQIEAVADGLHHNAIRLLRFARRADEETGIPSAQLSALSVLVFAGPQTLSTLAAAEQVRAPTMSQIVAELERKGLARRTPIDRRSNEIGATAKGKKVMEAGRQRRLARLAKVLAGLTGKDLSQLQKASAILARALETAGR